MPNPRTHRQSTSSRIGNAVALLLAVSSLAITAATNTITLTWDIPKDALDTNASVQVYSSTNILTPIKQWQVITNVQATTNLVQIQVTPGKAFYACTFSNFWGVSDFSNVAATPPLVNGDSITLGVEKTN